MFMHFSKATLFHKWSRSLHHPWNPTIMTSDPPLSPFPNTSHIINMSLAAELRVHVLLHAFTTSHFSVFNFSALLRVICFKTLHVCPSETNADWNSSQRESHIPKHGAGGLLHHFQTWISVFFFFKFSTFKFTMEVEIVDLVGVTFSTLTISDPQGEMIRMSCSRLKAAPVPPHVWTQRHVFLFLHATWNWINGAEPYHTIRT